MLNPLVLLRTKTRAKTAFSKMADLRKKRRSAGLLCCFALALATSGCDDAMNQDADCPANPGVTLSATELTPSGRSAQELRTGLNLGSSFKATLHKIHSEKNTEIPLGIPSTDSGVTFDLAGAPSDLKVTAELLSREEGLAFHSVGVSCKGEDCLESFRCVERTSMAVDLHIRAVDGSIESVIPVDLVYYAKDERDVFPGGGHRLPEVQQGKHVFYGKGWSEESRSQGTMRIVDPAPYEGWSIGKSGFGVRVEVVDQKILSLKLTANFEIESGNSEGGAEFVSYLIYSTKN